MEHGDLTAPALPKRRRRALRATADQHDLAETPRSPAGSRMRTILNANNRIDLMTRKPLKLLWGASRVAVAAGHTTLPRDYINQPQRISGAPGSASLGCRSWPRHRRACRPCEHTMARRQMGCARGVAALRLRPSRRPTLPAPTRAATSPQASVALLPSVGYERLPS